MKVLLIHGPNLNMLGQRETDVYGSETLDSLNEKCKKLALELNLDIDIFQSNHEGEIIDKIQSAHNLYNYIIMNPGAFTHYSYAIRDAIASIKVPVIEVHISNIYKREDFRHKSVLAPVVLGQIAGFGVNSYLLAIRAASEHFNNE